MLKKYSKLATLWVLFVCLACAPAGLGPAEYDLVVLGGTPSGVVAAVAAARSGCRVCLISDSEHLGGLLASGLGALDYGDTDYLGGIPAEVFRQIAAYYRDTYGPESPQYKSCCSGLRFEPHVAGLIFERLAGHENIELLRGWRLAGLQAPLNRIDSLLLERSQSGERRWLSSRVFLDATYTGDLFAEAGAPFSLGREERKLFGEDLAGVVFQDPATGHPLPGSSGTADSLIQACSFNLCLTDSADNSAPWPEPESYDPGNYRILHDFIRGRNEVSCEDFMTFNALPNRKFEVGNNISCPLSADLVGGSQGYPEGTYEERRQIEKAHLEYLLGLWKFFRTDPGIPSGLRERFERFHPAADEFTENRNLPFQLDVREARRLHGLFTFTGKDALTDTLKRDAVGVGGYPLESHATGPLKPPYPRPEGYFLLPCRPFQIPYSIMLPTWVRNLLVSCCVSASHVGYAALGHEPVRMVLGQAAGQAAALCVKYNCQVDEIPLPELQALLRQSGAILSSGEARPFE